MTYGPQTLIDLGHYWTSQGGVNLGIVGNNKHCAGYHLGRDRIFGPCACRPDGTTCVKGLGSADYSLQTSRDRVGLTDAASAIDLGKLNGTITGLRKFSDWLAKRCLRGVAGTADIKEVIYSPDGKIVLGFKDGVDSLIPGYGDLSHLTHTHISWYRDSEARDKRPVFMPYFALPDSSTEEPMIPFTLTVDPKIAAIKTGAPLYLLDGKPSGIKVTSAPAAQSPYLHRIGGGVNAVDYRAVVVPSGGVPHLWLVKVADCTLTPVPAADTKHTVTLNVDGSKKYEVAI